MHELSIAMSILDIAEEEAQRQGAERVASIHLKLGPLSGVVKEALLMAFELAREGTSIAGAQLVIQDVPVTLYCSNCHQASTVDSIQQLQCSRCGTPSADIRSGRELEVVAMEIEP